MFANGFITQETLQQAVDLWYSDRPKAEIQWGPIFRWNVSNIADMSNLFRDKADDFKALEISDISDAVVLIKSKVSWYSHIQFICVELDVEERRNQLSRSLAILSYCEAYHQDVLLEANFLKIIFWKDFSMNKVWRSVSLACWNLCQYSRNHSAIREGCGIELLLKLLLDQDYDVHIAARGSFAGLSRYSYNGDVIREACVIHALINLLTVDDEDVRHYVLTTFHNVAFTEKNVASNKRSRWGWIVYKVAFRPSC
jgi:hypothetical protein